MKIRGRNICLHAVAPPRGRLPEPGRLEEDMLEKFRCSSSESNKNDGRRVWHSLTKQTLVLVLEYMQNEFEGPLLGVQDL